MAATDRVAAGQKESINCLNTKSVTEYVKYTNFQENYVKELTPVTNDIEDRFAVGEIDLITEDIDSIMAEIRGEMMSAGGADYDRMVTVEFPAEAAVIHGISHMHISVRNLLTWFVMHNPSEQARIVALRDDFYAGDSEDDYSYQIDPGDDPSVTAEDRALARAARMETRAERDEARAEITAEYEAGDRIEREVWAPFLADRRVLEAERETHWQRADALDAEWDGVVSHGADDSSEERLSAVKADLVSRSEALCDDQEAWSERWAELEAKAWHAYERRQGDAR